MLQEHNTHLNIDIFISLNQYIFINKLIILPGVNKLRLPSRMRLF